MEKYIKAYGVQKSGNGVYIKIYNDTLRVVIVYRSGTFTDFPIQYENGLIAYDEPNIHSRTTKNLVKRAYKYINTLNNK